ncbi:MAG: hypothetical protein LBV26_07630 [Bacteroidales bacterium]|nr:hypothetical protein [Bacteroidales bacterium]
MKSVSRYDKPVAGFSAGTVVPLLVGLTIWLFSADGAGIVEYLKHIESAGIVTHIMSLCVFSNVFVFIVFNRLDMLGAAKGTLAVTIIWAIAVFAVKLL